MANVIKIKRSTTNTTPASLEFGELALYSNGSTNKIYVGNSSNNVVTLFDSAAGSVDSFVTTLSGLSPNTNPVTGAVTLSGTLGVANGGTGSTSAPTPGGVVYGINSSAIGTITAGTAGDLLISNGSGAPAWTDALGVSNRKVIIKGGTANVANFNLGTGAKNPTVADGDFWWGPNDRLYFKPIDPAPIKTLAYSTDIGDGTLTIAASGTGLSVGSPSTFSANQSGNATITITSNANTANGANTIVARDASGNFAAGTITASLNGNASTATSAAAWTTARTITLDGDLTGNVSINGSQNVTLTATIAANSVALGTDTTGAYVNSVSGTNNEIEITSAPDPSGSIAIIVGLPNSVNIRDNLIVGGDLTVHGDTVTVNTSTLSVEDPLIKLGNGNSADSVDLGFYGQYETGEVQKYSGLFRDASDSSKFKLFTGLEVEPTTTINTAGTGYTVGTLVANLEGNASTATDVAGGAINQILYQSGSGDTAFISAPTQTGSVLLSGTSGALSSATWANTTGTGDVVRATSPTLVTPALGTPTSGTLSNCTGLPISSGVSGLGTNVAIFLANPTSANLANAVTGETGSGALVFATSPTLVTPTLGVANATSINKVAITAPASNATLTIANGKTLTVSNTLTFTGTDSSSISFGTGGTVAYTSNNLGVFGSTTSEQLRGVISDETGTGVLVYSTDPNLTRPKITEAATFNGSTSGTTTLVANAVSGNSALILPVGTGTLLYDESTIDGGVY